jgi:hypothetical protein
MFDGDLGGAVRSWEMHLVSESSLQERSSWRLRIPADHHARRNWLRLAHDVQALRRAVSKEMGAEELKFPMVDSPFGGSQMLKGGRRGHC